MDDIIFKSNLISHACIARQVRMLKEIGREFKMNSEVQQRSVLKCDTI